jgi:hypothetical protein
MTSELLGACGYINGEPVKPLVRKREKPTSEIPTTVEIGQIFKPWDKLDPLSLGNAVITQRNKDSVIMESGLNIVQAKKIKAEKVEFFVCLVASDNLQAPLKPIAMANLVKPQDYYALRDLQLELTITRKKEKGDEYKEKSYLGFFNPTSERPVQKFLDNYGRCFNNSEIIYNDELRDGPSEFANQKEMPLYHDELHISEVKVIKRLNSHLPTIIMTSATSDTSRSAEEFAMM